MVVYQLKCSICGELYIGQTARQLHKRLSEHLASVKKNEDDFTISTHFREMHNDTPIVDRKFTSLILETCPDFKSMMITESILISKWQSSLNVYSGKWKIL